MDVIALAFWFFDKFKYSFLENNDVAKKAIDSKDKKEQSIDDKSDNLKEEDIPF